MYANVVMLEIQQDIMGDSEYPTKLFYCSFPRKLKHIY